jgi:hypothetical protein
MALLNGLPGNLPDRSSIALSAAHPVTLLQAVQLCTSPGLQPTTTLAAAQAPADLVLHLGHRVRASANHSAQPPPT